MCHSSMQHAVNTLSANNSSMQMFTYITYQQHMLNHDPYAWLQTIGWATCSMQSLASRLARHPDRLRQDAAYQAWLQLHVCDGCLYPYL